MIKHKNETLKLLDTMIENADKGPSGFWTEDFEGCGNPKIFPEFEEGLKRGRLIQKPHYLCPWNTAILFGNGRGNINTGCYHSCSFHEAKYLLRQNKYTATQIAEMLGYESIHYFCRQFKKSTGQSPTEYAKTSHRRFELFGGFKR